MNEWSSGESIGAALVQIFSLSGSNVAASLVKLMQEFWLKIKTKKWLNLIIYTPCPCMNEWSSGESIGAALVQIFSLSGSNVAASLVKLMQKFWFKKRQKKGES